MGIVVDNQGLSFISVISNQNSGKKYFFIIVVPTRQYYQLLFEKRPFSQKCLLYKLRVVYAE